MTATRLHSRPVGGRSVAGSNGHGMAALLGVGRPLPGAACADSDLPLDTWFGGPQGGGQADRDRANDLARGVCARCPAIAACLAGALERRERHGMFGGFHEGERDAIVRGRTGPVGFVAAALSELEDAGCDLTPLLDILARYGARGAR